MPDQPIYYDSAELKQKLEQKLDILDHIRYNDEYGKYLGEELIEKVNFWAKSIRRQKDLPFTVVVCGEFKRGKSSLINALLAEDVSVTNVTPETITLNRISYGEHANALVLPGGKRMILSDEQLCRESLEPILVQQGGVCQLEIKRPIEILKHITIVDTPGMEDAMQDFSPMVIEALNQADAAVYVFSVNYPISRREQMFIKSVLLPQKHTDLMLIANYADMLRTEKDYWRMREMLEKRMENIIPGMPLYMLSALDERCRQLDTPRPNEKLGDMLAGGFLNLRNHVDKLIAEKSDMVLPDRMERMFSGMNDDLGALLDALEHGVTIDRAKLLEEKQKAEALCAAMKQKQNDILEKLSKQTEQMYGETLGWISDLVSSMRDEAEGFDEKDILNIRQYYSVYCVDTLQDALMRCMEYHLDLFYEEVERDAQELYDNLTLDTSKLPKQNFRFALNNKTWTMGDNVYMGANNINAGVFSLIAMGVAGFMREKELSSKKDTLLNDLLDQLSLLQNTLQGSVKRCYDQIRDALNGEIQKFYSGQIEALQQNMEQMMQIANHNDEEKKRILQTIEKVRRMLEDIVKD